ncbi:MAG: hypothetical protein ACHQEA_07660 [Gaiellales bacterium]
MAGSTSSNRAGTVHSGQLGSCRSVSLLAYATQPERSPLGSMPTPPRTSRAPWGSHSL